MPGSKRRFPAGNRYVLRLGFPRQVIAARSKPICQPDPLPGAPAAQASYRRPAREVPTEGD